MRLRSAGNRDVTSDPPAARVAMVAGLEYRGSGAWRGFPS